MDATNRDFIAQLDAAIGCQQCGHPLDGSPSDDFCNEACQERWHAAHTAALVGYVEPWDLVFDAVGHGRRRPVPDPFALAHYRRRMVVGVTPGGEVVGRELGTGDGRLRPIGHVADHVVQVAGYSGPPSLAAFVEQAAHDRAHLAHEAAFPAGWIERHLNITLADWQVEILRGQYEGWTAVLRRQTEQMARAATSLAPIIEQMGRAAADAVAALRPLAESLAPPKPPADARERALWLRRNRNTGPAASARAPRAINPRRGR